MTEVALVTGASGFVGSHLAAAALDRGYRVRCLVRRTSRLDGLPLDRLELVYGDVGEPSTLPPAVEGAALIFHAAGLTRAPRRADYFRVNADGTRNLVRAARKGAPGLRRFALVSSLAAGGTSRPGHPRREGDPDEPLGDYGVSKKEGEAVLKEEDVDLPWTIVRPPAVYGPRDRDFLLLARLVAKGTLLQVGRVEQQISLIHAGDLAKGVILAAESDATRGGTYHLSHPEVLTWTELGKLMAGALGKRVRVLLVPRSCVPVVGGIANAAARIVRRPPPLPSDRLRDLLAPAWTCDTAEAERVFGFRAETDAKAGVPETIRWYVREGWL
jgi:nucleoside-diphosphate-sugar epimerase